MAKKSCQRNRNKAKRTISQGMKHYFMSGEMYYSMLSTLN